MTNSKNDLVSRSAASTSLLGHLGRWRQIWHRTWLGTWLCGQTQRIYGGVKLADHKRESFHGPIVKVPLPKVLRVPLQQHRGVNNRLIVAAGQRVDKGQVLAEAVQGLSAAVHAPSSGVIARITELSVPHADQLPALCVEIASDGQDRWQTRESLDDYRALSPEQIVSRLNSFGIVGLGGALFPTDAKLAQGERATQLLIVNAAECEPYISCDQALLAERAAETLRGIEIASYACGAERVLIGIEDNKPESITALRTALAEARFDEPVGAMSKTSVATTWRAPAISLQLVPTRYPTGGERQLIQALTGREVPIGQLPAALGIRVLNVATAYAIERAIHHGEPLISRIVTVSGDGVAKPANVEALIGTPMGELIEHCGGYSGEVAQLTMGGPMMGIALSDDELPVIKSTNCLIAHRRASLTPSFAQQPCIRCGACATVCPAKLLPQQLYWYARARDLPKLRAHQLDACIECGACAYVCPSHIPLVQYYRYAKSEMRFEAQKSQRAEYSRQRFEAREQRLATIAQEKAEKFAKKRAALEASKRRKDTEPVKAPTTGPSAEAVANDAGSVNPYSADTDTGCAHKGSTEVANPVVADAIAAALARVKAKKAERGAAATHARGLNPAQQRQIDRADSRRKQRQDSEAEP